MITLKDSIEGEATPEEVVNWLVQRLQDKESCQAWHPDHVDIRWIKGEPIQEGSALCAEEYLHGVLHKLKFRIIKVVPNRLIEYRILFSMSPLAPANSFVIEPKGKERCLFGFRTTPKMHVVASVSSPWAATIARPANMSMTTPDKMPVSTRPKIAATRNGHAMQWKARSALPSHLHCSVVLLNEIGAARMSQQNFGGPTLDPIHQQTGAESGHNYYR